LKLLRTHITTTVIVEIMLIASSVSMFCFPFQGIDCLFLMSVLYHTAGDFVKPKQGFFLFPYIYYRHFRPLFATLSAALSQVLQK
jgi:hypothetical protein